LKRFAAMAKLGCINPPAAAASIIYQAGNAKVKKLQVCRPKTERQIINTRVHSQNTSFAGHDMRIQHSHSRDVQWLYVFMPTLVGCSIMIAVAILVNNMSARRKYPQFW
jgi:CBS-domain-containing membrane protein